jgi:hypothetical protein
VNFAIIVKGLGKTDLSQKIVKKMRLSYVQAVKFCDNRMKRLGIIQTSKISVRLSDMCKLWDSDNRKKRLGKTRLSQKIVQDNAIIGCTSCEFCDNRKKAHKASICKDCPKIRLSFVQAGEILR